MSRRTVNCAIESDLQPQRIYEILANALRIPDWAPVFAEKIEHVEGMSLRVTKGADTFNVDLIANESSLTVDYLRDMTGGRRGGAYLRVMPQPFGGSVVVMMVPVGTNTPPAEVAAVLEQELEEFIKLD
jgi:hypothetical protein